MHSYKYRFPNPFYPAPNEPTIAAPLIVYRSSVTSITKCWEEKKSVKHVGSGKSINMSSGGVLFTTETGLLEGERIELAVSWPVQLDDRIPLKLVAIGVLVRTHETQAAMSIERYEFKTRGIDLLRKSGVKSS
jgi:hypothetical protein